MRGVLDWGEGGGGGGAVETRRIIPERHRLGRIAFRLLWCTDQLSEWVTAPRVVAVSRQLDTYNSGLTA